MKSTPYAVLALAICVAAAGCKKNGATAPMGPFPAPVSIAAAESRDVPVYIDEIGRTVAREWVSVQPQVSGRVLERHFTDGGDVKAGDPLFTLDARPFQAQLNAAEASLAQARATLDLAKVDFTRSANLLEQKAISQQDFDTNKNAVAVAESRVKQNEAAVETARLNLEYCSIKSPIDGRAGQRLVDVGNIVEANKTSLLVVQKVDPIYADFTVAEKHLAGVQGQMAKGPLRVEIRLPEGPGEPVVGELTFLDSAVQQAGTVKLRATAANADRRLWPGQFVKVRLVLDTIKGAVLVPSVSLQMSAHGPYVFVVSKDSTAEMRPVKTGQRQGDQVVIVEGVQPGDQVVTTIHPFLMPGGPITVVKPAAPQGGKP
jgi:multidrug efflux system membrane fusion protein